jgi:uncharacterized protein YktB (UPF0637 family)
MKQTTNKMKTITKSVIQLSEIPKHLQEMFKGHKIHTYAEFHIDDDCNDDLSLWLIDKYPTIKMKVSFLIHIDIEKQQQRSYSEEEIINIIYKIYDDMGISISLEDVFEQFKRT